MQVGLLHLCHSYTVEQMSHLLRQRSASEAATVLIGEGLAPLAGELLRPAEARRTGLAGLPQDRFRILICNLKGLSLGLLPWKELVITINVLIFY